MPISSTLQHLKTLYRVEKDTYTLHVYTVRDKLGYTLYVHIVGGG
jgi:hypothetical protein